MRSGGSDLVQAPSPDEAGRAGRGLDDPERAHAGLGVDGRLDPRGHAVKEGRELAAQWLVPRDLQLVDAGLDRLPPVTVPAMLSPLRAHRGLPQVRHAPAPL